MIITFANTKGGAGKTTATINLAVAFRLGGYSVGVVDADPQQHAAQWLLMDMESNDGPVVAGREDILVAPKVAEEMIQDRIIELADRCDVVLVDLQGSANQAMIYAIGVSDLVIVPVQPSGWDNSGAAITLRTIRNVKRMTGRDIREVVLLTRTNPSFETRAAATTRAALEDAGIQVMKTEFMDRTAFREMTYTGLVPLIDKPNSNAAANMRAIYDEILFLVGAASSPAGENEPAGQGA